MPEAATERRAWMYGIARHQALHTLRKGRRGRRAVDELAASRAHSREDQTESLAMRDLLGRHLRPKDSSLFILRYVHGFSAEALAEMTGTRPATVRKRLERSAAVLRTVLDNSPTVQKEVLRGKTTFTS
jgi:RNA polymerase sigma-70 factor (ECF subfamily)